MHPNGGTGKTRERIKLGSSSRNFQSSAKTSKKASWGAVKRLSIDEISMRKGHQDFVTLVSDIGVFGTYCAKMLIQCAEKV